LPSGTHFGEYHFRVTFLRGLSRSIYTLDTRTLDSMSIGESTTWHGIDEFVEGVLEAAESRILAVNPTEDVLRALALSNTDVDIDIVASDGVVKDVFSDFIAASHAAAHVRDEKFTVRVHETVETSPILTTEKFYATPVYTTSGVIGTAVTDEESVESIYADGSTLFENGEEFDLRTPPIDEVRETLEAEVGEELYSDFDKVLENFDKLDMQDTGIDVVETILLLGARQEILLYEASKWGESIGLASKATFSRAKSRLEDRELIDTVKVPIDVGRPRLRLLLDASVAGEEDPVELVRTAADRFDR